MSIVKKNRSLPGFGNWDDDFWGTSRFFDSDFLSKDWIPAVNVKENENSFQIELAVPGMKKDQFDINIENDVLTVSGKEKYESEEEKENYTRKEFGYSTFKRSFTLPQNANENVVDAKYTDGILYLTIGKKEDTGPTKKTIQIK